MNKRIIITIILFIFSILYLKQASFFIRENDKLMKTIKEKQTIYNIKPVNAIITKNTMIPGISGKIINLENSYKKMKAINSFKESLLVYDKVIPEISINNIYDKVIISGNINTNNISVITDLSDNYCYTLNLTINKDCILNKKHTLLIYKITNNHLSKVKELVRNGIIFYLVFNKEDNDLELIKKYLKNNNYEIVNINKLIEE